MPAPLLRSRSSWAPPAGKLGYGSFDFDFKYASDCLWIVGLDGSDLSFRALRLAAFLMNPKGVLKGQRDNLVAVTVLKDGEAEESKAHLLNEAKVELLKCGVMDYNVQTKAIQLPAGWEVGDALVYFANHAGLGIASKCHFVLGAQGIDKSDGAEKMARLGSIAEQCLAKVKVPITIVKSSWGTSESEKDLFGRPIRAGRDGNPKSGLHIVCCVDGTPTGDAAFDLATSFTREGDTLTAVHVTGFLIKKTQLCEAKYGPECAKVCESRKLRACEFVKVPPASGSSISGALVEASRECDVLVMGSVELANIKKRHVLGSVAMGIAKNSDSHMCVVKNFAH